MQAIKAEKTGKGYSGRDFTLSDHHRVVAANLDGMPTPYVHADQERTKAALADPRCAWCTVDRQAVALSLTLDQTGNSHLQVERAAVDGRFELLNGHEAYIAVTDRMAPNSTVFGYLNIHDKTVRFLVTDAVMWNGVKLDQVPFGARKLQLDRAFGNDDGALVRVAPYQTSRASRDGILTTIFGDPTAPPAPPEVMALEFRGLGSPQVAERLWLDPDAQQRFTQPTRKGRA